MLTADHIKALEGTMFSDVRWFPTIESTNTYLAEVARDGGAEGIVVATDDQRAGKGRAGRTWQQAPGSGLAVSMLLRPELATSQAFALTALASLAVSEVLADLGAAPLIKWPNDTLIEHRKLVGILTESSWVGEKLGAGVVGIGINVRSDGRPPELDNIARALDELGIDCVVEEVLVQVLNAFDVRYRKFSPRDTFVEYRERCFTLGQRVRVEYDQGESIGVATAIDEYGALEVVEDATQERRSFSVGDVTHLHNA